MWEFGEGTVLSTVMERPVVGGPTASGGGDQLGFCNHTVRF